MPQVGVPSSSGGGYGPFPVFSGLTLLNAARNLKTGWDFDDFLGWSSPAINSGWAATVSGAGAVASQWYGYVGRPGIVSLATGTTAGGYAGLRFGNWATLIPAGGIYTFECDFYPYQLSTVAEEFDWFLGFGNLMTGDPTNGCYFQYDRDGIGVNWQRCSADNGVRTKVDTGVAVVAGAWVRLKVVINAAGTAAEFFIDGVSVGSNVTNIPTLWGRNIGPIMTMVKSAGLTTKYGLIDWAWLHWDLITSR